MGLGLCGRTKGLVRSSRIMITMLCDRVARSENSWTGEIRAFCSYYKTQLEMDLVDVAFYGRSITAGGLGKVTSGAENCGCQHRKW